MSEINRIKSDGLLEFESAFAESVFSEFKEEIAEELKLMNPKPKSVYINLPLKLATPNRKLYKIDVGNIADKELEKPMNETSKDLK